MNEKTHLDFNIQKYILFENTRHYNKTRKYIINSSQNFSVKHGNFCEILMCYFSAANMVVTISKCDQIQFIFCADDQSILNNIIHSSQIVWKLNLSISGKHGQFCEFWKNITQWLF